jgi:hypothetical protein
MWTELLKFSLYVAVPVSAFVFFSDPDRVAWAKQYSVLKTPAEGHQLPKEYLKMAKDGRNVYEETSKSEAEAAEKQKRRAERRAKLEQELSANSQK